MIKMTNFQEVTRWMLVVWSFHSLVAIAPCMAFSNCTAYCTENGTYVPDEDCGPYGYCCGSPPHGLACCTAYYMEVTDFVIYNVTSELCLLLANQTDSGQENLYHGHSTAFTMLLLCVVLQIFVAHIARN